MKTFINIILMIGMLLPIEVTAQSTVKENYATFFQERCFYDIINNYTYGCENSTMDADEFATALLEEQSAFVLNDSGMLFSLTRVNSNTYIMTLDDILYTFNYAVTHSTITKLLNHQNPTSDDN